MNDVTLVQTLINAGFKDDGTLRNALAVVFAESGARCDARNTAGNKPPSTDRGLFQINSHWHPEVNDACAYDCLCNAKEPEWNNKSTEVDIIAGHGLDNVSKWITYFIPATKEAYRISHGGTRRGSG